VTSYFSHPRSLLVCSFTRKDLFELGGCIVLNEHNTVFASKLCSICNRCFLGPTQSFLQSLSVTDRQTTLPSTRSVTVTIGGIYVRSPAMCLIIYWIQGRKMGNISTSILIINRLNSYLRESSSMLRLVIRRFVR